MRVQCTPAIHEAAQVGLRRISELTAAAAVRRLTPHFLFDPVPHNFALASGQPHKQDHLAMPITGMWIRACQRTCLPASLASTSPG